jgi:hypothetical protein
MEVSGHDAINASVLTRETPQFPASTRFDLNQELSAPSGRLQQHDPELQWLQSGHGLRVHSRH